MASVLDCAKLYNKLCKVIPGGVNSPFRAFDQVGGTPRLFVRGQGSRVYDSEGKEYIDLCCGWGPLILGHSHPAIVKAVQEAAEAGVIFGTSTPWELEFVELIREAFPSMEMIRLVNSGAEAVMSAIRVARSYTGRTKIIKFAGCYHGHVECIDAAEDEAETEDEILALGASPNLVKDTLVAHFNDLESVDKLLQLYPASIAAIIVEPVTGSMGVIPPQPGFLSGLRSLCDKYGCILIFDEVLTGFRIARGGAQERYQIHADLTCLGKALAGGLPAGAYGGRREKIKKVSPCGAVYQAGTFCGNPITTRAGIVAQKAYADPDLYTRLEEMTQYLTAALRKLHPQFIVQNVGSMFSLGFGNRPLRDYRDAKYLDTEKFAIFFHNMLRQGIYLPPSTFDAACLSSAHTHDDLERIIKAARKAVASL